MGPLPMIPKATYILVPRRVMYTLVGLLIVLLVLIIFSFQYTNYVSRQLCGLITISDNSYKTEPPSSDTGKLIAHEFDKVRKNYHCK